MTAHGNLPEWLLYGLGTLLSLAALRMLWQPDRWRALAWGVGWGSLAAAGALCLLVAADCGHYRAVVPGAVIATVAVTSQAIAGTGTEKYRARVATRSGTTHDVELSGNHWIFDIQTIRCVVSWCPVHLYRGRHFYAARAPQADRLPGYDTVSVRDPDAGIDVWRSLKRIPRLRGIVQIGETSTAQIPVLDGAIYEIRIDAEGHLSVSDTGH